MSPVFEKQTRMDAPREAAFRWHESPGAFECLAPPWENLRILRQEGGIRDGGELVFQVQLAGPLWQTWHARHYDYIEGEQFCDSQVSGPFARWKHRHHFRDDGDGTILHDQVEYALPFDPLSRPAQSLVVERKIRAMFAYRAEATSHAVEAHHKAGLGPRKILLSGSGGLVGGALRPFLASGGHTVLPLRRGQRTQSTPTEIIWNPEEGFADGELSPLEGLDAVVHLAGESILGAWTEGKKKAIRESRVLGTRHLAEALARLERKPSVLVCASAVGFYGDTGGAEVTETQGEGRGFLPVVAREWEEATAAAREAGIRVVNLRIGMVLSARGGALRTMKLPFSLCLGGRLGSGRQYMPWIGLNDLVGLIHHALATESMEGPVNAVAPNPVTNREFTATLAGVLGRIAGPPAPEFLLRGLPGGMGREVFLASCRAVPRKALQAGYRFRHPSLQDALRHQLGRPGT